MADRFAVYSPSLDSPMENGFAVTPTDTTPLPMYTRKVWVGGAGAINCIFVGDTANTLISGITAGTLLPFRLKVIHSTGTTATLIIGLT